MKRQDYMITVVVPVMNEESNIASLLREIDAAARACPISEIIYVDDGSSDRTYDVLRAEKMRYPALRIIRHSRRSGQSAALWTGVRAAGNDLIVTLDGDGQNNPGDIGKLYDLYLAENRAGGSLMIAGERARRHDNLIRRVSSRWANRVRAFMLKDSTRDTGCSLKLFRRADYLALPYFNHMHRFLPALMIRGGVRLVHVPVSHRPRSAGTSKYGTLDRLFVSISDLLGVRWLQKRANLQPEIYEELS
jgi:dolichol-phosphate mannosyltransferase